MENWTEIVARDWLTEQITLKSFFSQDGGAHPWIVELNAQEQPGDQWWKWISGDEPLMQMGGIALVREGTIVYAALTWIS